MVAAIKQPGWIRGLLGAILGAAFGFALVVALRKASGLPAYLEASSSRSAALYRRLGFETVEVVTPFGSPPIELMRRPPT